MVMMIFKVSSYKVLKVGGKANVRLKILHQPGSQGNMIRNLQKRTIKVHHQAYIHGYIKSFRELTLRI
jgi:hypothetical protein